MTNEQIFICPICEKRCKSLASIKTHFNGRHNLEKCPVCGAKITSKSTSAACHFVKKSDAAHLAYAYLYLKSNHNNPLWNLVCNAANEHFSSRSALILLLKKRVVITSQNNYVP
jgi:hypothetical protein